MRYERRTIKIYENTLIELRKIQGNTDNERVRFLLAHYINSLVDSGRQRMQ